MAAVLAPPALWLAWPLPEGLIDAPPSLGVTLEDRSGIPLRSTRAEDGSRSGWIRLDEVDPQLLQAFIAVEDRRFYRHHGVDVVAVGRALVQDVRRGSVVSGASTITMQLARALRPMRRGWRAKLAQAAWALRLELHLSKTAILEQYLNRVPLGQGTVGVAAASALYFDGTATHLSLGQASLLAGLARAPSADNPFADPAQARSRRNVALNRMVALGYVSRESADRAAAEPVAAVRRTAPFLAPHFTSRVLQWNDDAEEHVQGVVRTSLDLALQAELEAEVRHTVALLRDDEVRQAAAVVLDNATGAVLAWVGSPDFWADTAGQVDMVVSPRQPGSALKPFVYGLAFDRGFTAASVLPDIPRTYFTATGPYQPRNYDRHYHGPVRAREALASSFNVPAVELTERLGPASVLRVLHAAGFRTLSQGADRYGLGLALGNGDVTLLELANAYRGLANGGRWSPVQWWADGVRGDPTSAAVESRRFVSRGAAVLLLDVLSDAEARVPGFGVDTPFDLPFPVAVKTGTSHHFTDNWAVGVSGNFTVAVWVGNFSGRPMRRVSGVTGAGPLLRRALLDVSRRYAPGSLPSPAEVGAVRVAVCRLSGQVAGAHCPTTDEWFLPGTAPRGDCDWHRGNGAVTWPAEYADWAAGLPRELWPAGLARAVEYAPSMASDFRIVAPLDGDRYQIPPGVEARYATIALRATSDAGDGAVRWWVDGRPTPTARWSLASGRHRIRAVAASGRSSEVSIEVR